MAPSLVITTVSDPGLCRELWEQWSPRQSLSDLWEFRDAFRDAFAFPLHFLVANEGDETVGVLPLWYQSEQKRYLWFGDTGDEFNWQEDTTFWARDAEVVGSLLTAAPGPLLLTSLSEQAVQMMPDTLRSAVQSMNAKAVLPLSGIGSAEEFLQSISKKLRGNIRRDIRRIEEQGITLVRDDPADFDALVHLNKAAFVDSPFTDERITQVFRSFLTREPFRVHLYAARLGETTVAVDYVFLWNGVFHPMLCGADTKAASGIGHYMNMVDIGEALSCNAHVIDFAETEEPSIKTKLFPSVPQFLYASH